MLHQERVQVWDLGACTAPRYLYVLHTHTQESGSAFSGPIPTRKIIGDILFT